MRRKSQVVPNLAALAGLAAGILLALTTNGEAQQSISPQPDRGLRQWQLRFLRMFIQIRVFVCRYQNVRNWTLTARECMT